MILDLFISLHFIYSTISKNIRFLLLFSFAHDSAVNRPHRDNLKLEETWLRF